VDYSRPYNRRRMAVIVYASFVAGVRYRQKSGNHQRFARDEMIGFHGDVRHLDLFGYKDDQDVISDAVDIVTEHWDAVLRVADALDAAKTLSHRQVVECFRGRAR
jgi:hypothetical protein